MAVYIPSASDYGKSLEKTGSQSGSRGGSRRSNVYIPSASAYGEAYEQRRKQEEDSADLVKKINLMVERKEPLDKIAKDLNVDYEALKQSVSKINPKYEQEVKASKRSLLESAAAVPGELANWFVEDLIKKEIIDPAVEGFTAAEKVRRAQETVGDMNRLDILKKNREFNRKQLFGDEAKWTAAQRNDKNFIAKVQKYDTETQQKLANFSKKIDYNAIKESSELDPLKTAGAISQTFLNVASAGFLAPAKAAATAIAKQTAGLAGREIAKKQARELTEQELKKAASKLTVKRNKEIAKVIGTELAKDVPFGAAYGVAYTARNVDDPTFKDYLENSLIGGAFAAPFSIAGPLLSKATKNRMTKKAQKLFVENAQQLYNQRQKILVASGLKSRAQARLDVKEYNVAIKKAAKDMDISGFQGNIGQTVSEQPLTNLRTGTTKQVTKAEAEQAAEIASRRAAGEVAEDVTKQVDTAAIETAEAAADEAALPVIDDRINTIEAIPEAQRTAQQSVDLGKARMQRDAVLNRVAERAKRAQVGVPEAPGAARLGRPVTPTGVAPEIIQARQAPIVSRAQALEEVPLQREPTVPGQQPLSVKDLKGFNKFSLRINKLTAELEKTKIREQKYGRTRDTLRVSQLERLIRGLKAQPAYRNIASRVGLEDELGALGDIVDQAYDLAVKNDGVTISLGGKIPTNGVAFSPYKEFETRIKIEDFSKEDVQTFVDRNMDVLNQDGNNIGLWVEGGDMMIDVSRVVELDEAAIKAAQSNEQLAMWDIARGKEIRIGQEQNGVYSVVDEASNIFNKYKEEAPTAGGGRGVGELREVREGEQARGEKTPRAAKEEVATDKAGYPAQLDTDQKFLDELNSLTQVGRVSGDMLDKLNEFVSRGIESVIRPFKELPPDAKARQWYDSFVRNFQDNTAGVVKVIAEGVRKGVISRDELTNVLEEMSSVKRALAPAIHFWNNSQNYQKLIAPIEGKTLSGKRLDDLNEYIVARTELNLMNIDKVDNPARKAKFERIIKQYESPEYKERYDALVAYHDELLTKLVDSGIVSQEKANLWRNTNQEYVRVQRVMDDIVQRREAGTRQIASFRTTKAEQRRKGSTKEAQNLIYVAAERAQQVFEEIARNDSANAVVNALKKLGEDYADPVRLAENVYVRNSLKESLALSRPLKVALNRFVKSQSKYVARISKEVDDLNMQGLNTYLRQGAKDKKQINLTSKVKILQDVDPDVPLQSLKNAGKWRGGNAPDLDTVKSAMARTRYRNGVTGAYTPALKAYAKRNGLSEDEALVRLYMAEKRFDGYEFNGKEFIINDKKLAKEAGDMLVRGEIKGKVRGATATETRMGLRNTVDAVDNIISYPTSQLLAVKRKLANREPKLAQAIDELVSLKSQVDELNATRRAEWEEIVRRSDAEIAGKPTIARRVNGIDEVYTTTPEIEAAVKLAGPGPFQGLINFLNPWTRALTATVTGPLNPAYAIKALIRDQFESVVLSRNVQATHDPKNIIGAIAESVKNDDLFIKFMETEGSSSARIDYIRKPQSAARLIREQSRLQLPPVVKTAKLMTDPVALWRKIEDVSRWQEILYRWQNFRGVYDYAIKSGKSEAEALVEARYAARNNMVDFFRGGDYSPLFNALYPYFNASIQGGVQLGREFRDRPVTTSIKVFTAVQIPTIVTTMYNLSDPRRAEIYFDLSQYERDNNWILILPGSEKTDGRWETIKIPKPPGVGGFSNPIQKTLEGMYGFDPVEFMDFVQAFAQVSGSPFRVGSVNEFTGSLIPQQIKPTISAVANYDFFFGKPIVPEWMKAQEPDPTKQAFENTSFTAQQIGKAIGVSPLNVEKFLRDTLGETSRYGIYGLDTASVALGIAPESQVGGKNPLTGLLQNLYTSPGGAVNAKVRDRVDNLLNTKNSISKDINELLKVEDYAAANRLAATYNFEVDAILEANYDRPEFVRTAMKQLEYLESLKFPMEDGYLTDASIKARLKRLQKRELE